MAARVTTLSTVVNRAMGNTVRGKANRATETFMDKVATTKDMVSHSQNTSALGVKGHRLMLIQVNIRATSNSRAGTSSNSNNKDSSSSNGSSNKRPLSRPLLS